eukprot:s9176_g1.t1
MDAEPFRMPIFPGMRITITKNEDKEHGFVNGMGGVVQQLRHSGLQILLDNGKVALVHAVCKEAKHWMAVDPSYDGDNEHNALASSLESVGPVPRSGGGFGSTPRRLSDAQALEGTEEKRQMLISKGWTGRWGKGEFEKEGEREREPNLDAGAGHLWP